MESVGIVLALVVSGYALALLLPLVTCFLILLFLVQWTSD